MTSSTSPAAPSLRLVFTSLLRADFLVFLKHRRALIISMVLPVFVLVSTSGNKPAIPADRDPQRLGEVTDAHRRVGRARDEVQRREERQRQLVSLALARVDALP